MANDLPITALRVANEAFLVASTIERCPKTMMLRELVMNAIEAAGSAPDGQRRVAIRVKDDDKLCIWNTGHGMSAAELHRICDLASSLHKQNALDRNFGMGAKVAALPSNKLGLRYRSCHQGRVSEVTMGQREGIYGRIPYRAATTPVEAEVADVTALCRAEGGYDLSADWTEVTLFGNQARQNTVTDPYGGDPKQAPNWITDYLGRRFFRVPEGTALRLESGIAGPDARDFHGMAARLGRFTQVESVVSANGITLHYAYDAREEAGKIPEEDGPPLSGQGAVVFRDEIYALRQGAFWMLDGPLYGISFGAAHFAVFVELPDDYAIRPDLYRQFLRFAHGDQRQVYLADFSALVRASIPAWLRDIIASYGPPPADYMDELENELSALLAQLGVPARPREATAPRLPAKSGLPAEARPPSLPRKPVFEVAPEIIGLRDEAQIAERGLLGRAGKFYPATHQIFVNLTYPAVLRMRLQLEHEFAAAPDQEAVSQVAGELAEWTITLKVCRAVVFGLAKKAANWSSDELGRAQSTETLSIAADDYAGLMEPARLRMADRLGVEPPMGAPNSVSARRAMRAQREAVELAEAQQAARAALQKPAPNVGSILRRVSNIEARRRNWVAALEWATQAIAFNPEDSASHLHIVGLLQQQGDLPAAARAAQAGLKQAPDAAARLLRQASIIAQRQGQAEPALDFARKAVAADTQDADAALHLSGLLLNQGQLEAADAAAQAGIDTVLQQAHRLLRQRSSIAERRGDMVQAVQLAQQAIEAEPTDGWSYNHLSAVLQRQGQLDAAEAAARQALETGTGAPSRFLRQLSLIAQQRQDLPVAIDWASRSIEADPNEGWSYGHLASLQAQQGDLLAAERTLRNALAATPNDHGRFYRQLSGMAQQRQDGERALSLARQAVDADPQDGWSYLHLANLLAQQAELDAAEQVARDGILVAPTLSGRLLRQLSNIAQQRHDEVRAIRLAQEAIEADPQDGWSYSHLAGLLQRQGQLDAAAAAAQQALETGTGAPVRFLRQLSVIAQQRRDMTGAIEWARRAVEVASEDGGSYDHLSNLLLLVGDLDGAQDAADRALSIGLQNETALLKRIETIRSRREMVK